MRNLDANAVINRLKKTFSHFGVPANVVCNNVPFNSTTFKEFAKEWNFDITYSSPRYPKSNSMAEKAVGIGKKIIKKAKDSNNDLEAALLKYNSTPTKNTMYSPSQLLQNRILRTKLPTHTRILKPKIPTGVKNRQEENVKQQKHYYNQKAKEGANFNVGQYVTTFNCKTWEPAKIIGVVEEPRSYYISTGGAVIRRNASFLRSSRNAPPKINPKSTHICRRYRIPPAPQMRAPTPPSPHEMREPFNPNIRERRNRKLPAKLKDSVYNYESYNIRRYN